MLAGINSEGYLPAGVHVVDWAEFQERFGIQTPRRVWLVGRLRALIELAQATGALRRCFVWGSFVTAKPTPRDLDVLLIMADDFEVDRVASPARQIFEATAAKLRFEADVFWARGSIGEEVLQLWLETYQISRDFQKRGIVELRLT
ncbi:MAG: hypothetical protein JST93_35815 [Acidobacteria bacterium]|nr:hypothetical protein [Acidobacteriota bacterium]